MIEEKKGAGAVQQMNSLADNENWDEMSDCSAEVPSEHDDIDVAVDDSNNAAYYQPKKYEENYHKASKLLAREEKKRQQEEEEKK